MISALREAIGLALVPGLVTAALLAPSVAGAQQPFYQGKRLSVLVNFAPGGSTDIEGRLFARHVARHLGGTPTVVVQNMDGAGGFNGANYVGEIAPRDGTLLGFMGGTAWQYATDPKRFRADLRSYEFIAFQPGTTVYYVRTDVAPGMKAPSDIVKAQGLVAGGNGVHNSRDLLIRLGLDMLGVRYRYVTGYRSGQTARLALQRNEVSYYAEPASAYRAAVETQVVKPGIAIPVYVDPIYNGERLSASVQVEGMPIPAFQDLYRKLKGSPPSGELWDTYLSVLALTSAMGRLIAFPPNVPEAAVAALREATAKLNKDKVFIEDAVKVLGFAPNYVTGPDTNRLARATLTVKPETRAFVADYIKRAKK